MAEPHYTLPETLTVKEVDEVKEELQEVVWAFDGEEMLLDGSRVQNVDASGVQLLLSLYKTLLTKKKTLSLQSPSEQLQWAINISGTQDVI